MQSCRTNLHSLSPVDEPLITVHKITIRIADHLSFHSTDWKIQKGQHWGIIGATGSGKSTLADALCRKVPLVQGRIQYFFSKDRQHGRSYLKPGEILRVSAEAHKALLCRHAAYHQARWQSFEGQDAPVVSELLTGKSIEHRSPFEVTPLRRPEALYQQRRDNAVKLLGIEYLLARKIIHLSHGEARKVMIARALMQSPELLILDDPFSGLDTASRSLLREAIEELFTYNGLHILLLTSRSDEILEGLTHLLCVKDCRVMAQGERASIPKTDFLRSMTAPPQSSFPEPEFNFPSLPQKPRSQLDGPLVEMKKVSVHYGQIEVLHHIDWTMNSDEHWAVLGHNGAGKSTLLSLILGDNPQAYANDLKILGIQRGSGESIWDLKRQIGWLSPELLIYYHGHTTCYAVVCSGFHDSVGLYRHPTSDQRAAADTWISVLGLERIRTRPLSAVSAGEQRMVLLARALVKDPRLVVLDEPCQGLDAGHRTQILTLLDRLCGQGAFNIMYVTHHVTDMPDAVSHVLVLKQGRVAGCGVRHEILGSQSLDPRLP
ncbi:hypothetical protein CSB45_07795 [candidate division KSB3 bacterium]|uniref:ABC transporter domain-containing protein n=1 Tax=candidate division KSB3 bacterium TaxID=2044937 RepID=A0A2G6E5S2_9BACT|nr:MAG: hypothetical protein CSB45_07795 [candidate division KSB3 bacterium]PIE29933.1 MAG: hypothetical protein CSA57_06495 [candidate division KSB3 bacterium]